MRAKRKLDSSSNVRHIVPSWLARGIYRMAWTLHKAMCRAFDSARLEFRYDGNGSGVVRMAENTLGGRPNESNDDARDGSRGFVIHRYLGRIRGYRPLRNRPFSGDPGCTLGCSTEATERRWKAGMSVLNYLTPLLFLLVSLAVYKVAASSLPEKNPHKQQYIGPNPARKVDL